MLCMLVHTLHTDTPTDKLHSLKMPQHQQQEERVGSELIYLL